MSEQPTISLTLDSLVTLAQVQRWAELAEALHFPATSRVELGVGQRIKVTAYLAQAGLPDEFEPARCYDALCVVGQHDDDVKHFDGKEVWG